MDRLCQTLFLAPSAQEKDDNLLFVRERLLKSEADLASLLDLYGKVRAGQRVQADDTSPSIDLLRLSGIVRVAELHPVRPSGRVPAKRVMVIRSSAVLRVRNRIYEKVFDRAWVTAHMPDAELRRQRAAFHRGLMRAAAVSAVIVAAIAGLALVAVNQAGRAHAEELRARLEAYDAEMNLAQQAWDADNVGLAQDLLEAQRPRPGQEDLRGFEWRYLWRLCHHGEARSTLQGDPGWVGPAALSPDGRTLASGSTDGTVKLWDMANSRNVAVLRGPQDRVGPLKFSPDGRLLATGSIDALKLWDVRSRRQWCRLMEGPKRPAVAVFALAFSPDGQTLASGHWGGDVTLWSVPRRQKTATLNGNRATVWSLSFSPDGKLLASAGADTTVKLWRIANAMLRGRADPTATFKGHTDEVDSVAFSRDGKTVISGSRDRTAKRWDVVWRPKDDLLQGHTGTDCWLAFSPDSKLLAGTDGGLVKLWDVATGRVLFNRQACRKGNEDNYGVQCVAFSPDGKILASGSGSWVGTDRPGELKLWDVASGRELAALPLRPQRGSILSVAFSPDGRLLACTNGDRSVTLWKVPTCREWLTLPGYTDWVDALAFSPDSRILATLPRKGLKLWDVGRRRDLATLSAPPKSDGLAVSPDGRRIVVTSHWRSTITVWDLATKRAVTSRKTPSGPINNVAFCPDGKSVATGHDYGDTTVKLWDVATQRVVANLRSGAAGPQVAFSPDGNTLASMDDWRVHLWRAASFAETDAPRTAALRSPRP